MNRIDIQSLRQDKRVDDAQRRDKHGTTITVVRSDPQAALKLLERRARRLRSAEAQVADLRLALGQEIARAIDTTQATRADIVRAAGRSAHAGYHAIERIDARRKQQKLTELTR